LPILLFNLIEAIIRNNRVILHDENLKNEEDDSDIEEWTFVRNEGRRLYGEENKRKRREIFEWKNKWHNKAKKWGKSEEELKRFFFSIYK
jgi:hypothetical protein